MTIIAFDKIDKQLFIEKQKIESQKVEEYEKYKNKMKSNENMKLKKFNEDFDGENEIDNFTARYYDNYDDEEDNNSYEENSIDALRKIQLYEDFIKKDFYICNMTNENIKSKHSDIQDLHISANEDKMNAHRIKKLSSQWLIE